jgi:cytochrome c553
MKKLALLGVLAMLAPIALILSGVIAIKASSGHWRVTAWLLDLAKRRSVATHAIGIEAPPLDRPALIDLGSAHYDSGCRPCHGVPFSPPPMIHSRMTPHPPDLGRQVGRWKPQELFYIVKHGIKFTGMPAWPSTARDDEIWAVVAYLQSLPRRRMPPPPAGPLPAEGPARLAAERCARCHGIDGRAGVAGTVPRLAGQRVDYLRLALDAYAFRTRHSGIMGPIAASLDEESKQTLASYYARLDPPALTDASAEAGSAGVVWRGDPARDVPACIECHGAAAIDRNPAYPRLAGQTQEYLLLQLELLASGRRGGSAFAPVMREIASRLTPEMMRRAAADLAELPEADR